MFVKAFIHHKVLHTCELSCFKKYLERSIEFLEVYIPRTLGRVLSDGKWWSLHDLPHVPQLLSRGLRFWGDFPMQ